MLSVFIKTSVNPNSLHRRKQKFRNPKTIIAGLELDVNFRDPSALSYSNSMSF